MIEPEVLDRLKHLAVGVVATAFGLGILLVLSVCVVTMTWVHMKSRPPRTVVRGKPVEPPKKEFY